jgi:hypothetical protein
MADIPTELRFETARFNLSVELDHFLNPGCFGQDAAAWLRWVLLLRGVEATPPGQEDWGWYVEAEYQGEAYLLGVSGFPASGTGDPNQGEWSLLVHKHRTFWERLLGRNKLTMDDGMVGLLREIVSGEEDFTPLTEGG